MAICHIDSVNPQIQISINMSYYRKKTLPRSGTIYTIQNMNIHSHTRWSNQVRWLFNYPCTSTMQLLQKLLLLLYRTYSRECMDGS